ERNVTGYVEIGPDGVLTALAQAVLAEARPAAGPHWWCPPCAGTAPSRPPCCARSPRCTPTVSPDWSVLYAGTGAQRVELPTYAFDGSATGRSRRPGPPSWPPTRPPRSSAASGPRSRPRT
ncbi:hypothetical protein, partial [Micromonospora sp. b486]|uniref:hypothetical protein n=1 Tax=Micromonospora sp. b486 TaxID=3053986 RepID=UPI00259CD47B